MKKVGILMSLATVLVVGGVYATWSYGQGTAASATDELAVVMTAATVDGTKGSFSVSTTTLKFEIGNKGEYHPELRANGEVVVTFTPRLGADTSVVENGVDINWSISLSEGGEENWKYDSDFADGADKLLFNVTSDSTRVAKTEANKNINPGSFVYSIPAATIATKIALNVADDFVLDTKAKYDSFNSYLDDYKFVITISEAA